MKTKGVIGLAVLVFLIAVIVWLKPVKSALGSWVLDDGSKISLAGVTYGTKHTMRYGNAVSDYFYAILTPTLRKKLGCKVESITTSSESIVVWIRTELKPKQAVQAVGREYTVCVVDSYGMESEMPYTANARVLWRGTNLLEGWKLEQFPRRSEVIKVRVYYSGSLSEDRPRLAAEFKIPNRIRRRFSNWPASVLPVTVKSNDLELSLSGFVTGLSNSANHIYIGEYKNLTRAEFVINEHQKPAGGWSIRDAEATSASGESRVPIMFFPSTNGGPFRVVFPGTCWLDEPAWKLKVELWRTAHFPQEELWTIKQVTIPSKGTNDEPDLQTKKNMRTNIYGSELEFVGLKGFDALDSFVSFSYLHIRSPLPSANTHFQVVEIRDDRGRKVEVAGRGSNEGTGGRGATIRELNEELILLVPNDAKTLDITLAYTRSRFIEFMAKPTPANMTEGERLQ